jgi:hypothetical protein
MTTFVPFNFLLATLLGDADLAGLLKKVGMAKRAMSTTARATSPR